MAMPQSIPLGSSANPLPVYLTLASDNITPATGITPETVEISKSGAVFGAPSGAWSEVGNGWYEVAGNALDTNTLGPLWINVAAATCTPFTQLVANVVSAPNASPIPIGVTTYPFTWLMIESSDHVTAALGLSPTATIAKFGGVFVTPMGAVSEVGNGVYKTAPNPSDTDTSGPLFLHATATGADPSDTQFFISNLTNPSPSTVDQILIAVGNALIGAGVCSATQLIITLFPEPPPNAGVFICFLTPQEFHDVTVQNDGAGRYASGFRGTFQVHVVTFNNLDIAYQDYSFITDPTYGVMGKANQVIDALQDSFPLDQDNRILTEEPIRLTQIGTPKRYGQSYGWGGVPLTFEVTFAQSLTLPGP